ncbi:MAG TPA: ATP-binding protein [Mycobacteriales bacterium]|nr:ATP-binding protein [Mycobacteriales bacterium]
MDGFDEDQLQYHARALRALVDRVLGEFHPRETGEPTLVERVEQHLGENPLSLPVVTERWAPHEQADAQVALEHWLASSARDAEIVGTPHHARRHQTFAEMLQFSRRDPGFVVGPPDWVHVPVSPDDTHPCVSFGIYLVAGTPPLAVLLRGPDPQTGNPFVQLEVVTADAEVARELVAELRRLAIELSPVRGQIVTLAPPDRPGGSPIAFLRRPQLTREQLVLPEETLVAVERQVVDVAALRDRLRGAGQHLKRGLLLYGPPGTGKTHTVRYLLGQLEGATAVVLSGVALHQVAAACELAKRHQPSVVILEDVDLVAGDRSFGPPGSNPLLFEVLNQLDGLGDDVDVVFILTTNRVEVLERALAERPGRVDEAVEVGAPDAGGRERLLRLYGATAGIADLDLATTVEATEGLTATFLRELTRRAVIAATTARPDEDPVRVQQADLDAAVEQLQASRAQLTRALLGESRGITHPPGAFAEHGFESYVGLGQRPGLIARRGASFTSFGAAFIDDGDDAAPPSPPPGWADDD